MGASLERKLIIGETQLLVDQENLFVDAHVINLDGRSKSHLNFVSQLDSLLFLGKIHARQLLISEEAHAILSIQFPKGSFLPVPFHHPIVLGPLTVELMPAGEEFGSSFLSIEKGGHSIVYASQWRQPSKQTLRRMASRRSQTLLIRLVREPAQDASKQEQEKQRLLEYVGNVLRNGEVPVLAVEPMFGLQVLSKLFLEAGIEVFLEERLFQGSRVLLEWQSNPRSFLSGVKKYTSSGGESKGVVLFAQTPRPRALPSGIWAWVGREPGLDAVKSLPWLQQVVLSDAFQIESKPDMNDIEDLVRTVQPSRSLVFGPGAAGVVRALSKAGFSAELLARYEAETLF